MIYVDIRMRSGYSISICVNMRMRRKKNGHKSEKSDRKMNQKKKGR